jgi:polysaccharide deacetylase family protein (PEP-CTERM system associated)
VKHALSFDIEDWFHIVDIPELEVRSSWNDFDSIVEEKTDLILKVLEEFDTKATFFILGWIAQKYPHLSKKIASAGHEIGSHSFWHRRVYEMDPEDFKHDLSMSIDLLEQQTGQKVKGFRAPSFSITPGSEWAFDIISELGLLYDASLFPAARGHGGYPCSQEIHMIPLSETNNYLIELPMSIQGFGPVKIPFSGGGYLRFLPSGVIHRYFNSFENDKTPVVVYLHPRDFAPEQPRVKMPLHRKFKSYIGLSSTEQKLRNLLEAYSFDTCMNVMIEELRKRSGTKEVLERLEMAS